MLRSYTYGNSSWGDQLTSYDNQPVSYDAMGNPTSYLGSTLTWEGKQLISAGTNTYAYDENGLRTQKTTSVGTTDYYYNGSVLMGLTAGNDVLLFFYDQRGKVQAVRFNGTYYYYLRNGQGDIIKLIDNSENTVVEYAYDTWGKQLNCTGTLASTLGVLNPFRYRGYVYDEETQWYYLQSRYYDPETCRFLSADVMLSTGQGVLGHNTYAYCLNNPVNHMDSSGKQMVPVELEGGYCVDEGDYCVNNEEATTKPSFIDDQHDVLIKDLYFGIFGNISNNGCGIVAMYNLCIGRGDTIDFNEFRFSTQFLPIHLVGGTFGVDPICFDIFSRLIFGGNNVKHILNYSEAENYDALVYCYLWQDKSTGNIGGHYFTAINEGNKSFKVYNDSSRQSGSIYDIRSSFTHDKSAQNWIVAVWGINYE